MARKRGPSVKLEVAEQVSGAQFLMLFRPSTTAFDDV